jgi:hypothetical protein
LGSTERCFVLGWRDVAAVPMQPFFVELSVTDYTHPSAANIWVKKSVIQRCGVSR